MYSQEKGKAVKQKSSGDVHDEDISKNESDETIAEFRENHGIFCFSLRT